MTIPPKVTKEMVERLQALAEHLAKWNGLPASDQDVATAAALAHRVIEPDEETVERCARALCDHDTYDGFYDEEAPEFIKEGARTGARAVLAALVQADR